MAGYTYEYEPHPQGAEDPGRVTKNVAASAAMDEWRARYAPTASEQRQRVLRELASTNGHGPYPVGA